MNGRTQKVPLSKSIKSAATPLVLTPLVAFQLQEAKSGASEQDFNIISPTMISYIQKENNIIVVYIYIYICVYTHTYIYIYIYTRQTFIDHHQWMFIVSNQNNVYCVLNNWCICINISCGIYIYIYIYTHTHTCIHVYMYTCIHVQSTSRPRASEEEVAVADGGDHEVLACG